MTKMGVVDVRQPLGDDGERRRAWHHDVQALHEVAPDLPVLPGPLTEYRQMASFNWKQLRVVLEDPETLRVKMNLWRKLEADPVFAHPKTTPSIEEQKRDVAVQLKRFVEINLIPREVHSWGYKNKTKFMMAVNAATASWNKNLSVKFGLGVSLFTNALLSLGTERHLPFYEAVWDNKFLFCLGMTEVGHGSNTKSVRTTATYDPKTQEFVINTPDFEAAKCWAGNLGKTCTHAMLFAQLYTADSCHGLHAFLVPIRDPETLTPYPGVKVGDIGEKAGLNGIDNGFAMFDNFRIPRENLLNRTGDVTPEGEYESCFQNPEQILGAALENLLAGRVAISQESTHDLCAAVTISVRYAAVRKQGSPRNSKEELSILEYPLHQWRLFPYVAAACSFKVFMDLFTDQYLEIVEQSYKGAAEMKDITAMAAEVHAIVSAMKPLITWTCASALQESREACGGHGYLKAAILGTMRADHDATVTYEGDNNVLSQQASNWVVRHWSFAKEGNSAALLDASPLGTLNFLLNAEDKLKQHFTGTSKTDVMNAHFVMAAYEWLLCWLTQALDNQLQRLKSAGVDRFTARAEVQAFYAKPLALAYGENNILCYFWEKIQTPGIPSEIKCVLERLLVLYGLWGIQRHFVIFYRGGYASGSQMADLAQEACQAVCNQLKPDIIAIIDAIAHPDAVVKSILGRSDGRIYDHLYDAYMSQQGHMERPAWWREVAAKPQSKL